MTETAFCQGAPYARQLLMRESSADVGLATHERIAIASRVADVVVDDRELGARFAPQARMFELLENARRLRQNVLVLHDDRAGAKVTGEVTLDVCRVQLGHALKGKLASSLRRIA